MNARPSRRSDGQETHAVILEAALRLASIEGLGSLTIGRLARETGISKSGVFAHFRSKQALQKETIEAARETFRHEVLEPGLDAPEGIAQVLGLCEAYLSYVERGVFPGGCFFAQLLGEFDAPSGLLHDEVVTDQVQWLELLEGLIEVAVQRGQVVVPLDTHQLAFDLYAPLELANYLATLHRDPSLVVRGRRAVRTIIARVAADPPVAERGTAFMDS